MTRDGTTRELSAESIRELANGLAAYLRRPGNRGAAFLLDSKGLRPADRRAVVLALADLEAEA